MRISQVTQVTTKTRTAFAAAIAMLVISATAAAQPGGAPPPPPPGGYYPPPPPSRGYAQPPPPTPYYLPPPNYRRGLTLGIGAGFGDMDAENTPIRCLDCDYNTGVLGFDLHIGGMINPRLALLFEAWGLIKPLDSQSSATLYQSFYVVSAQYWVNPRLWLKAGIGFARLGISYGDTGESESIDDGGAIMGAVGYELITTRRANHEFSLDLQLRLGAGSYEDIAEQVGVGTLGLGFNWY